ncbi:MAG: extracellular solute-binding protein [Lachnospiraceae bacterium]|nr:extracellular solute-binding protein [Lachnospiraceae bacterium]
MGDRAGWNYDEIHEYLTEVKKGSQFLMTNSKEDILRTFIWLQTSDFIDNKTGKNTFNSDDFKRILEICNVYGTDSDDYEWDEDEKSLLKEGKLIFKYSSTDMDTFIDTISCFNNSVSFIGYPAYDKCGNYIHFSSRLGILSGSEKKEAAWKFLKTILTDEYQKEKHGDFCPTREDSFEEMINDMDKAYVDQYRELAKSTEKVANPDEKVIEIIEEEATKYFAGDRDIDATLKVIDDRVGTYMSEKTD